MNENNLTDEGIRRISELVLNDIKKMTYTLDNVEKEKSVFKSEIKNGVIEVIFKIDSSEVGTFDNFKLVGKEDTTYISKVLNFQKNDDEVLITFEVEIIKNKGGE